MVSKQAKFWNKSQVMRDKSSCCKNRVVSDKMSCVRNGISYCEYKSSYVVELL